METDPKERIGRVEKTRDRVLHELANVTESQGGFKPSPASWSIQELVEHLVLAEEVGQWIDFLAFHMERHLRQIRAVMEHSDYPAS